MIRNTRNQTKDYPHETFADAEDRFRLNRDEVEDAFHRGILKWELNRLQGKYELVGDLPLWGSRPGLLRCMRDFYRFLKGKTGLKTFWETFWWGILFLTIGWPIMLLGAFVEMFAGGGRVGRPLGTSEWVDLGGGGIFDEVSTRRQEELQWMLGTGKYAGGQY